MSIKTEELYRASNEIAILIYDIIFSVNDFLNFLDQQNEQTRNRFPIIDNISGMIVEESKKLEYCKDEFKSIQDGLNEEINITEKFPRMNLLDG